LRRPNLSPSRGNLLWLLVALLTIVWAFRDPASWGPALAKPQRQTVPLTPPPTWTPQAAAREPTPTQARPRPPTRSPDRQEALPWLGLSLEPGVAGPDSTVVLTVELANVGGAPLTNARVVLPGATVLAFLNARASSGRLELAGAQLVWLPEAMEPRATQTLLVNMRVSRDAPPDSRSLLSASVTWPGGELASNEAELVLPWALLPEAGG